MHNIETDLFNRDLAWISWYAAGMRAVEWRNGHFHTNANDEGSFSWNIHEVGTTRHPTTRRRGPGCGTGARSRGAAVRRA